MKIGKIDIKGPLILAPMEEVTTTPFRLICKRLGADIVFSEFASCEALIRDIPKTLEKIKIEKEERPIGVQIFGSKIESMVNAVKRIEKANPDFIDINAGCWARKHVGRSECAALLKDLPHFENLVKAVVNSTKLPVTVKTRLGWDDSNIVILDAAKMIEGSGAKALTVHCRTRNQAYKGKADWKWLEKIRKVINIPLIGNGDIVSPEDAKSMFDLGCDGIMIGRGAIANPWIFEQAKYFLSEKKHLPPPSSVEKIDMCIKHLKLSVKYKGDKYGIFPFRKFYSGYLKGIKGSAQLRSQIMQMEKLDDIVNTLKEFKRESVF